MVTRRSAVLSDLMLLFKTNLQWRSVTFAFPGSFDNAQYIRGGGVRAQPFNSDPEAFIRSAIPTKNSAWAWVKIGYSTSDD
jgi:hypothetical protein